MYVKLFSSLYQGTLRGRSNEILVFTNLLAYADRHGIVDKHFKAIEDETGLSAPRVKAAIKELESPDPESRSPEMNGCRIVKMDEHRLWGWKIVNYGKYRAIRNEEDRREQNRLAQEKWRSKQNKQNKPPSAQAEGEGEAKGEAKAKEKVKSPVAPLALPDWLPIEPWEAWLETRRKLKAPNTERALKLAIGDLEKLRAEGQDPGAILDMAIKRGWRGLFPVKREVVAEDVVAAKHCRYCSEPAIASVNGIDHCRAHSDEAYDRKAA